MFADVSHSVGLSDARAGGHADLLLAAFFALVIVSPWALWLPVLLAAGTIMVGALTTRVPVGSPPWRVAEPRPAPVWAAPMCAPVRNYAVTSVLFVAAAVASLVPNDVSTRGLAMVGQFAVLPVAAVLFASRGRADGPAGDRALAAFWMGMTAGALLSGVSAVMQVVVLGVPRAEGPTQNAVVFGNLAIVMGAVAVALTPPVLAMTASAEVRARVRAVTWLAALAAVVASMLSGTRGAWLAVPVTVGILVWQSRSMTPRTLARGVAVGFAGIVVAVSLSGGMPLDRAGDAVDNVANYVGAQPTETAAGTSIGARFEAWRSALGAFADQPLLGIGWGNLPERFQHDTAAGERHPRIATFDHAHQQVLGVLASGGLVGLVAWVAIVSVPARTFWRGMRWARDPRDQSVAATGLIVVSSFAVFGLTESIFESFIPLAVFATAVPLLLWQLGPGWASTAPPPVADQASARNSSAMQVR